MTDLPVLHHASVVNDVEAIIKVVQANASTIAEGLTDRPKPGAKQKAMRAFQEILTLHGNLWRFIEGKKPVILTNGTEDRLELVQPDINDLLSTPEMRDAYYSRLYQIKPGGTWVSENTQDAVHVVNRLDDGNFQISRTDSYAPRSVRGWLEDEVEGGVSQATIRQWIIDNNAVESFD